MIYDKKIEKYIGEILTMIGVGFFVYNVFNFSYTTSKCSVPTVGCESINGVAYFYDDLTLLFITLGAVLITAGFLIAKSKFQN